MQNKSSLLLSFPWKGFGACVTALHASTLWSLRLSVPPALVWGSAEALAEPRSCPVLLLVSKPHFRDASLQGNSIVIAFWIGLAAFVAFLFFILFYISQTGYTSIKNGRPHKTFPWNYSKNKHSQDVVSKHAGPTLAENQVEETEGSRLSNAQK